ncbi:DUF421 domain-containing protein [Ruminiclostridium cellobioparum]|uniref:Putative membrane protein n=1 Tax=Ruminiclostridium cellobioparum subsp. termitidis CT1112 TaxID=1195236 RepID=S0FLG4_RUMCE|nr:DUF421 domain-containing protein [Ruminiclostridium cellobioparum]EMS69318.1 putative membrane protein [Ruminiclostridium cellobioparum subsp. termitidis CT1112]
MQMWLEILLRTISMFILTLVLVRLMGKRNISRMTPFNLISYVVIAIIAALISVNVITNIAFGVISLAVWALVPVVLDLLSLKSKWLHDLISGRETVLIKHGKIMEDNLHQLKLTGEELLRELRHKDVFSFSDVEFAVMETTGEINVFPKSDKKPVTAHDLDRKVSPLAEPQTVILDGNILNEPLASLGLNREWLRLQLENTGVSLDNVFIGQVDSFGDLYLDLFDDSIVLPQPRVREMIYANIEKCHASLMTFALETKNKDAKSMYIRNAKKLRQLLEKLEPYLLR